MQPTTPQEFLVILRECLECPLQYEYFPRKVNNDFLRRSGIMPSERDKALLSLVPNDYVKGPEEDEDYKGEIDIWIFKISFFGHALYIKIKLIETWRGYYAKIISFHD